MIAIDDIKVFDDRIINKDGTVVYYSNAIMEFLYRGLLPKDILFYPENDIDVSLFNKKSYENCDGVSITMPDKIATPDERKNNWFYPEEYNNVPLKELFYSLLINRADLTPTEIYQQRIDKELQMYEERNMIPFLRWCIYFSCVMKEKDFVVGVGRGSSCASLLLYLLQIHLVNPIEFQLDITEFLK